MIVDPRRNFGFKETRAAVDALLKKYGDLLRLKEEGKSHKGREIISLSLGSGEKKLLAVGSIHGREYVTAAYLLKCLEEYCEAFSKNSLYAGFSLRNIFEKCTLQLVPMANPDGVEISLGREALPRDSVEEYYLYKNNARGVNLNANFPYKWLSVPKERKRGPLPKSERETELLMNLCERESFELLLSFHSRGNSIFWRDLGNGKISGDEVLAETLCAQCGFSLEKPTQKAKDYAGGFENWFRHRFSKNALCVELVGDEARDFREPWDDFYEAVDFEKTRKTMLVSMSL